MAYEVRISDWRSDVCSSDRRHFVGISANPQIPGGFGIPPERVLQFWDWVGGRYSLWSAIGLPIALGIGIDRFHQLLAGAHEMDVHFASAPTAENLQLLMRLAGIWNINLLGHRPLTVLPYDQAPSKLAQCLQQAAIVSTGSTTALRVGKELFSK